MLNRKYVPFLVWLLPLSFFTYQFILRLWPSLMMHQIMHQFAIDATAFGLLASVYYYGYAGMQIPIAIFLDRYGARITVFLCAVVCGLGMFIFSTTDNWYFALLSRFLIGAGSAVGFLGTSKVVSQWFSKDSYARMIGFSFTVGLMGAIYGGKPVSVLVERYSWQNVAFVLAFISIAIGLFSYLFLASPRKVEAECPHPFKVNDIKYLFSTPTLWLLAIANLLMVGALEGFADVWGVNYLMTAYDLSKSDAAELISFIFVGMLFGGPLLALLSKKLGTYTVISCCGVGMALAFFYLILGTGYSWYGFAGLFFCIGVLCCYQVIVFAAGCELVSAHLLGVTVAFLNCINMLGGSFFHTLIGFIMDALWTGATNEGVRQYTVASYQALLVIPFCALVGTSIVVFLKFLNATTHHKVSSQQEGL